MYHLDPRNPQCEIKVKKIVYLKDVSDQLPDEFNGTSKVTKSLICPSISIPERTIVPTNQNNVKSKKNLLHAKSVANQYVVIIQSLNVGN